MLATTVHENPGDWDRHLKLFLSDIWPPSEGLPVDLAYGSSFSYGGVDEAGVLSEVTEDLLRSILRIEKKLSTVAYRIQDTRQSRSRKQLVVHLDHLKPCPPEMMGAPTDSIQAQDTGRKLLSERDTQTQRQVEEELQIMEAAGDDY
ncbi:hypothetical protein EMCRGX_G015371 [Ephydatia muelleri]